MRSAEQGKRSAGRRTGGVSEQSTNGDDYRIQRPTLPVLMSDMRIPRTDPGPGDQVPAFDLPTADGGRFTSATLQADGRAVLLVFGSLTCPVTESAAPGLNALHQQYGDAVRFVVVNVREAHPGARLSQPMTAEQKHEHAVALARHHDFRFETAVDDLDGSLHRAFGTRPSSAYLIDCSGRILFRAHWSNSTDALEEALAAVTAGLEPPRPAVGGTAGSMLRMTGYADVPLQAAGNGASRDMWRVAPPFATMILASRLFSFLPRARRGLPAAMLLAALLALAVVAAVVVV